jgi:hypothetical protein
MLPFAQRNPRENRHAMYTFLSAAILCVVIGVGLSSCGSNAGSGSGSPQNPTPTTPAQVQKCGKVQTNPRGVVLKATDAKQAEDCFWQAFQKCSPASLVYTLTGVDTVTIRTFIIQSNGDHCLAVDAVQHTIVPAPLSAAKTYTCAGVTQKPDGLHFSNCGVDGDVVVSLQAQSNP